MVCPLLEVRDYGRSFRSGIVKVGRAIMRGVGVAMGSKHMKLALSVRLLVISKLSFSSRDVIEPDHPVNEQPLAG